jgi:hypothetical protein
MKTKVLQTRNIQVDVLEKADKRAKAEGLGSIQDAVRLFLWQYSQGMHSIGFIPDRISPEKEAALLKDADELKEKIKLGKVKSFHNVDELFTELHKRKPAGNQSNLKIPEAL